MWGVVCGFSSGGGGGGGDSAQLALLLLRSVSSYVEYSDCCLCASSIGDCPESIPLLVLVR